MTWLDALVRAIGRARGLRKSALGFILFSIFLDVLALGVTIPVLAPLVQGMRHGDAATAAGTLGMFGSAFALMTFLGSPFLGVLSDSVGRRPVLLIGLLALGLDYLVMGFAPTLGWLFAGRLISGLAGATGTRLAHLRARIERHPGAPRWRGLAGTTFAKSPSAAGWRQG